MKYPGNICILQYYLIEDRREGNTIHYLKYHKGNYNLRKTNWSLHCSPGHDMERYDSNGKRRHTSYQF